MYIIRKIVAWPILVVYITYMWFKMTPDQTTRFLAKLSEIQNILDGKTSDDF